VARTLGGLAVLLGGALFLLGWKASSRALHPATASFPWSLTDFPSLKADEVRVRSRTGVTLAGRFFRGHSRATIVLSHGYGGTQDEMLPVAATLHRHGFSVLTYDMRGCGASGGEVTFGAREQTDLRSVVDYAVGRPDVDPARIGALGFSMGAATTVMAAADDTRIRAVVDDSGWSHVEHWLRPRLEDVALRPRDPFTPLSLKLVELRTGEDLDELVPASSIGRLSPRPVLVIHGARDEVVPAGDAARNFAAAREPKTIWRVADGTHGATIAPDGASASDRVAEFFSEALRP
jgi:dipeptidyl aminopeptidase/acylaminoacyl peptidase